MIKFTILLRRKAGMSRDEFALRWSSHAKLFSAAPFAAEHVRRYVRLQLSDGEQLPGLPATAFDGAVELWFDDLAGLSAALGSRHYGEVIRPDEETFIDLAQSEFLLGRETVEMG